MLLAVVLRVRLGLPEGSGRLRGAALWLTLLALSATALDWGRAPMLFGDDFPLEIPPARGLFLHLLGVGLGAAAFGLAGRGAAVGAAFGLAAGSAGWCAARWPQLSKALELSGATFGGPLLGALLAPALAVTALFLSEALTNREWRPRARALLCGAVLVWAAVTIGVEGVLRAGWGYGPRSLSEAAGVPPKSDAVVADVAWLYPSRGEAVRYEERRLSDDRVDLSAESLERLEAFLKERRLRDVFADDALAAVRRGWLLRWDAERALDAAMLSLPGRAAPDYRRALELLRAGPLTDARLQKLRQLETYSEDRRAGFEGVTTAQYIFEGFSAAYARFGIEDAARAWLYRIDNLWPVNDKRIEVTPIEDMRDGHIEGRLLRGDEGAQDVLVGLFFVWRSSATNTTHYFLSGSTFPDEAGRFEFDALGPGRYHLALLAARDGLGGRVAGSPGFIELNYDRPAAFLAPIRLLGGDVDAEPGPDPGADASLPRGAFLPVPGRVP